MATTKTVAEIAADYEAMKFSYGDDTLLTPMLIAREEVAGLTFEQAQEQAVFRGNQAALSMVHRMMERGWIPRPPD